MGLNLYGSSIMSSYLPSVPRVQGTKETLSKGTFRPHDDDTGVNERMPHDINHSSGSLISRCHDRFAAGYYEPRWRTCDCVRFATIRFIQLITNLALWALRGLGSPLLVLSCGNERIRHDTAKSQFIQDAIQPGLSTAHIRFKHSLKSETSAVDPVSWADEDGTRVKLVDTPSFDDSREGITDDQVLKMIATFLIEE